MRIRKMAALAAALIMSSGSVTIASGYGDDFKNDEVDFKLFYTMVNWVGDDENPRGLTGEILSDSDIFVIQESYDDFTVKMLNEISTGKAECIVIPESCVIANDAFNSSVSLKAVYTPDSVLDLEGLDSDIIIVGNEDSYAEFFAENNGNEFILSGDIDSNGKIGASDLVRQLKYITGQDEMEDSVSKLVADMNHDGSINVLDLIYMKRAILGGNSSVNIDAIALPVYNSTRSDMTDNSSLGYINFASDFSATVLNDTDDEKGGSNRLYSPVSVYMAASVLAECCEDRSLDELLTLLDVSDKDELRKINQELFDSLYFNEFSKYCRISNSIWINDGYTCENDTLNTLASKYYTASFYRNLGSESDCSDISKWIYQNTSGKFSPDITPNSDDIFKIINTVTFKEKWTSIFDYTKEGMFSGKSGDVSCTYMHGSETALISEKDSYTKYTKKLNDGFEMNFVLPAEGSDPEELLENSNLMNSIFNDKSGKSCLVTATIPKFKTSSKFDLITSFKKSGVTDIFSSAAVWALIDPKKNIIDETYISEITHEAVIDVNEEGCEAAAYTIITATSECAYEPCEFTADRPFLYYISDKNGTPIFIGVLNNPNED